MCGWRDGLADAFLNRPETVTIEQNKKMEKKFLSIMDRFFTILLLISGEEDQESVPIGHIL